MLEAYRALGQTPPDGFRSWPLERVEARRDNVTARADTLREVLLLQVPASAPAPPLHRIHRYASPPDT